jgi:hypothetical protein
MKFMKSLIPRDSLLDGANASTESRRAVLYMELRPELSSPGQFGAPPHRPIQPNLCLFHHFQDDGRRIGDLN